ncbi:MAG: DNA-binding response regulator [Bacteroidetes bacterium]|nr:MAG: DNA-binding response regulator [Bacteroidota bacterium]
MLRILIVDDHAIVRKGIKQLLLEEYAGAHIEEAGDAESLVQFVTRDPWDVVLCDLNMPGRSGLDALNYIKHNFPDLPVLIMSIYPEDQYALRVFKAGASGYLSKQSIHDEILQAIQTVLKGRKYISPVVAELLAEAVHGENAKDPHQLLSDREFDIFKLLAQGKSVTEIAAQLSISSSTVSTYRYRILEKMNMRSNADLTKYAIEAKLI